MAALVADVASAGDRIVKRLVPGANTSYPAGFARLTDARHLLVVIDEDQLDGQQDDRPDSDQAGASESAPTISEDKSIAAEAESVRKHDISPPVATAGGEAVTVLAESTDSAPPTEETTATAGHAPDRAETSKQAQHDHWYFNAGGDDVRQPEPKVPAHVAATDAAAESRQGATETTAAEPAAVHNINRSAPPLRFVWRTDAEGKF
ncbi:MAG: PAS domain-containing sensor histidine kinase, partial [Mesorhizobium sp.]